MAILQKLQVLGPYSLYTSCREDRACTHPAKTENDKTTPPPPSQRRRLSIWQIVFRAPSSELLRAPSACGDSFQLCCFTPRGDGTRIPAACNHLNPQRQRWPHLRAAPTVVAAEWHRHRRDSDARARTMPMPAPALLRACLTRARTTACLPLLFCLLPLCLFPLPTALPSPLVAAPSPGPWQQVFSVNETVFLSRWPYAEADEPRVSLIAPPEQECTVETVCAYAVTLDRPPPPDLEAELQVWRERDEGSAAAADFFFVQDDPLLPSDRRLLRSGAFVGGYKRLTPSPTPHVYTHAEFQTHTHATKETDRPTRFTCDVPALTGTSNRPCPMGAVPCAVSCTVSCTLCCV
jgi:hypothetical protein